MKKLFLLALILISCKNENKYEIALENYIKEDLHFKQARIDLQLKKFKIKSLEQPMKYSVIYREANFINQHCLHFERQALNIDNTDSLNILYKRLKDSILNKEYLKSIFIDEEINKLPIEITNKLDKYELLRKLKEINFRANHIVLNSPLSHGCNFDISQSSILAVRLNDKQIALNIYSELKTSSPDNFDTESFKLIKLKDLKNNDIPIVRDNNDLIKSIIIETQSDTLFMDAIIQTKEDIGLIVSENQSPIIVGELKTFDRNNFKEYIDFYLNK